LAKGALNVPKNKAEGVKTQSRDDNVVARVVGEEFIQPLQVRDIVRRRGRARHGGKREREREMKES
jgi:hypothetical protein